MYILPELETEYKEKIDSGKNYLLNKKIVVVGLTRNSANQITSTVNRIAELHQYCKNLSCFLYENNSTDNTVDVLKQYRDSSHDYTSFQFYTEDLKINHTPLPRSTNKCRLFAYARNICKNFVNTYYSDYDYVIVIDPSFKFISLDGILNSFGWFNSHYDDIDAIAGFKFKETPDKILSNEDDWSYRNGYWDDLSKRYVMSNIFKQDPMLWFKYWIPPIGSAPIKVNSAFGGCCIYKTSKYAVGEYQDYDCDHVTFHKSIDFELTPFNIYANPSQIILQSSIN